MDLRASLRPALVALLVAALAGGLAIGAGACGGSPGETAGSTDRASAGPAALGPLGDPVPGAATVHVDLPYATESSAQRLDIYLPAGGEAPYPVLVAIHVVTIGPRFFSSSRCRRRFPIAKPSSKLSNDPAKTMIKITERGVTSNKVLSTCE